MNSSAIIPNLKNIYDLDGYLRDNFGYSMFDDAPPIDTPTDASSLNTIGTITLQPNGPARVWINPLENSYIPRRRFTLAHEIGHFCMHRSDSKMTFIDTKSTMNRSESYWDSNESEANNFAADLLMPAHLIKSVGRKVISDYKLKNNAEKMPLSIFKDMLAVKFKVSSAAMEYRLKNLDITGSKTS
jgi:hypothetical protein